MKIINFTYVNIFYLYNFILFCFFLYVCVSIYMYIIIYKEIISKLLSKLKIILFPSIPYLHSLMYNVDYYDNCDSLFHLLIYSFYLNLILFILNKLVLILYLSLNYLPILTFIYFKIHSHNFTTTFENHYIFF